MKTYLSFLTLCLLLFACNDLARFKKKPTQRINPALIHPLFFQEEVANVYVFPFWFNDSIVKAKRINQLVFSTFHSISEDTLESVPLEKKSRTFTFDHTGELKNILAIDFYDGLIIQSLSTNLTKSNAFGYANAITSSTSKENAIQPINYILKEKSAQSITLQATTEKERIHYLLSHNYFGPLSVDSIARPKPSDWIVLGKPSRPQKRYKVKNTVKESTITTYKYLVGNYPSTIQSEDYPFIKKRTFEYKEGRLHNFIDSVFVDKQFVTRINTDVIYQNDLPIKLIQNKKHDQNNQDFITLINISYRYFD